MSAFMSVNPEGDDTVGVHAKAKTGAKNETMMIANMLFVVISFDIVFFIGC